MRSTFRESLNNDRREGKFDFSQRKKNPPPRNKQRPLRMKQLPMRGTMEILIVQAVALKLSPMHQQQQPHTVIIAIIRVVLAGRLSGEFYPENVLPFYN